MSESQPTPAQAPPTVTTPAMEPEKPPQSDDAAATASAAPDAPTASPYGLSRQALEQEVSQVMGSFGSWWGGVKKQASSASALATLKADLDKTVEQAQADIEYLRNAKVEVTSKSAEQLAAEKAQDEQRRAVAADNDTSAASTSSFFDKLSTSSAQLQHTFQSTIANAANNPAINNVNHLRAQLAENLHIAAATQNLGISVKQAEKLAEDYLKRGDEWRREAGKWISDAVKVLPPDEQRGADGIPSWDGSDWYAFSTSTPTPTPDPPSRQPLSPLNIAGSRKDALLARLRNDQELLLIDPSAETESDERRSAFEKWSQRSADDLETAKRTETEAVGAIRMALESQRQAQDDFSWDEEPESSSTAAAASAAAPVSSPPRPPAQPKHVAVSSSTSPRDSEESYDLVSDQGVKGRKPKDATPVREQPEDEDSDWE